MERLTYKDSTLPRTSDGGETIEAYSDYDVREIINRLAAYEDTGLEPEQVKDAIRIAERIATADYPHNFQRERSDIADYMRWITDVMRDAKAWWNGRIKTRVEAEAAMKGVSEDAFNAFICKSCGDRCNCESIETDCISCESAFRCDFVPLLKTAPVIVPAERSGGDGD